MEETDTQIWLYYSGLYYSGLSYDVKGVLSVRGAPNANWGKMLPGEGNPWNAILRMRNYPGRKKRKYL